jgi:hypothetical protein
MALRNVGFGSAEIEEYPAAELKKAPSGIQRMPTAQTLIDYRLCASVGIAPEKRRLRQNGFWIYAKSPMRSLKTDVFSNVGVAKVFRGSMLLQGEDRLHSGSCCKGGFRARLRRAD